MRFNGQSLIMNRKVRFLLILVPILSGFTFGNTPTWNSLNSSIDRRFPLVKNMTTETLLSIQGKEDFLLIDVRTEKEYKISKIEGAIHLEHPDKIKVSKTSKIVVYCSVGYRSAIFADILRQKGYIHVWNLRGSIFEWANKGYPLTNGKQKTKYVHPYNSKWGVLLKPEYHRYSDGDDT
jgi:rhodanese-related sulfurtransferase